MCIHLKLAQLIFVELYLLNYLAFVNIVCWMVFHNCIILFFLISLNGTLGRDGEQPIPIRNFVPGGTRSYDVGRNESPVLLDIATNNKSEKTGLGSSEHVGIRVKV